MKVGGNMNVLGVYLGHDSSASLVTNGKIVADVAEERFTRIKHYGGVPIRSIGYCLQRSGILIKAISVETVFGFRVRIYYFIFIKKNCN